MTACLTVDHAFISGCSHRLHAALSTYEREGMWPKKRQEFRSLHPDGFGDELSTIYQKDYEDLRVRTSREVLTAFMDLSRAYGVRFASLTKRDFICFEGIDDDSGISGWGWPIAWKIARDLDHHKAAYEHTCHAGVNTGCGNGPQAQVGLTRCMADGCWGEPALLYEDAGIYDLREGLVRLCDGLWLGHCHGDPEPQPVYRREGVLARYEDGSDLNAYLVRAGALIPGYEFRQGKVIETTKLVLEEA